MKLFIVLGAALLAMPLAGLQSQATADPELGAVHDAELTSNWGVLASLAGSEWNWDNGQQEPYLLTYAWREPGRVLEQRVGEHINYWELKRNGRLVFLHQDGKDTGEKWSVEADGSVVRERKMNGAKWVVRFRADGTGRITLDSGRAGSAARTSTGAYVRLSSEEAALARAMTMKIQDGVFDIEDGSGFAVLSQQGDTLTAKAPTHNLQYKRQPNAEFHYHSPDPDLVGVYRIVDPLTVEFFFAGKEASTRRRLTRRGGAGLQARELTYGLFQLEGYEDHPANNVFMLNGNTLLRAETGSAEGHVLKADGLYHNPHGSGALRIVDMYTVDLLPPPGYAGQTYRFVRVGDAPPGFIAESRRQLAETMAAFQAQENARWAAEEEDRLAWEDEQYARQSYDEPTTNAGGILGGFMRGLSEATASNNAMEQSMRNAANEGLATGAAEYARRQAQIARHEARQRNADAEYARGVRMQESSAPRPSGYVQPGITVEDRAKPAASPQAPADPETRQTYAWCMALRPNQSVTYSTVQQITIPYRGWSDSSMREAFGAVAGGGVSICSTGDSYAAAQGQLEGSKTGHRGIKQATTNAILRP